jgi:hypothetical protein
MGGRMTYLTPSEREALVNYLYQSEVPYLVQLILEYMPDEEQKRIGVKLTEDIESDDATD